MRVGTLLRRDGDRARAVAGQIRRGTYSGKPVRFPPQTKPRLCECSKPWNGGEDYCLRCGKTLASATIAKGWR